MTATQRAVVDDLGNINVHGRSALEIVWKVKDAAGSLINISASDLFVEIATKLRVALVAGEDNYSRKLTLTRAQIATLPLNQPLDYALHDETPSSPATIWNGKITAYGFRTAPSGAAAVDPGTASWTGATVTVQQGESVPTVVVTYMGATGYGMPSGGTVGQYIRKSSSTEYDVAWDTVTGSDVGLGNVDNTSDANKPVSTAQQAALDLKLNLAGGTLSGVLAFVAGTAALPGLAVAGDLNTGIYGVSADVLGVSAGGLNVASFSNGQLSLATEAGGAGVNLVVDAANALALRNGASAQAFRVYNTYTGPSNYEMGHIAWQSNEFRIGTLRAGSGTGRDLVFQTNGSSRWYIASSGNFLPIADATYDAGSAALEIRDAYISRSVIISQAAIPAGGVAGRGVRFSSTANFGVFFGSGAPTLAAAKGSLYLRSDGSGTGDRMYVNTDGATAWTAVTTAT
jgi:hypothetical protein